MVNVDNAVIGLELHGSADSQDMGEFNSVESFCCQKVI